MYGNFTSSTTIFSVVCLAIASIWRLRLRTPASLVYLSINVVIVFGVIIRSSLVNPWS